MQIFDFKELGARQIASAELAEKGVLAYALSSVGSTSTLAREYVIAGGIAPVLIVADKQTSGRGRLGRSFYSPEGTGIYMTLCTECPSVELANFSRITAATAVSVCDVIERHFNVSPKIKWVNDVLLGDKKVCGILVETFFVDGRRYVSIGVGINLCTKDFPDSICDIAASVADHVDGARREMMTVELALGILSMTERVAVGDVSFMSAYRARSAVIGKQIYFEKDGARVLGAVEEIEDTGALLVLTDRGRVRLVGGEITLRLRDR